MKALKLMRWLLDYSKVMLVLLNLQTKKMIRNKITLQLHLEKATECNQEHLNKMKPTIKN